MATGPYTDPSFLVRQQIVLGPVTAAASGTSCHIAFPASNMRIRNVAATVAVAGTIGTNVAAIIFAGTSAIATCAFGTAGNTIGATVNSGDANATVAAGTVLSVKNGLDATATTRVVIEAHIDPASSFTG
jgi:hypothetical protein